MAEKVLKIKTLSEVAEAISGLTDLQGSLKGVGTAAFEAAGKSKGEWKALEAEWTKSTATAKGVATQVQSIESALNAMGRASSASQLEAGLIKSQVAFQRLQATIRDVSASGGTIDDGVVSSMNVMRASIDAGKAKLTEMKKETLEAAAALGLLQGKAAGAGNAISGLSSEINKNADSSNRNTDAKKKEYGELNKYRGLAMETWATLQIGKQVGEALSAEIEKRSQKMAEHDKRMADAAVNTIKFQAAMKLARQGLIDIGGSQDQFLARYDAYIAKTSPAVKATEAQTKAFKEQKAALDEMGSAMAVSTRTVEFKINAPKLDDILPLEEATKYAERLNDILKRAFEEGGTKESAAWAAANIETLDKVMASYKKYGEEVPTYVRAAYDDMKAASTDWIAQMDKENAAADATYQAKLDRWAAEDAAANRTSKAPEEFKRVQDEAFGAAVALGEMGTNLDRVAEAVVKTGGTMVVGAPIWITIKEATREAKEELLSYIEAMGKLTEKQAETLTKADGWLNYLVGLEQAHKGGTLSLTSYIALLSQFKTQISTMFGTVGGEAAEAVRAVQAAVDALIASAGSSGPVDNSYRGVFERSFNGGGGI